MTMIKKMLHSRLALALLAILAISGTAAYAASECCPGACCGSGAICCQ